MRTEIRGGGGARVLTAPLYLLINPTCLNAAQVPVQEAAWTLYAHGGFLFGWFCTALAPLLALLAACGPQRTRRWIPRLLRAVESNVSGRRSVPGDELLSRALVVVCPRPMPAALSAQLQADNNELLLRVTMWSVVLQL